MINFPSLEGYKNPVSEKFCNEDIRKNQFFFKYKEPKPAQGLHTTNLYLVNKRMSLYRPQVGHMQIKKLKKKGAGLRNPYPGISFASPTVDEMQKNSETFALV